ncbi:response regulator transcription factor [Vogesella sp. LIG4]|uniref:response regulator transcription factor n=1 Tax=Vogesella sp. LIG4 TaxID=1192162 RepID=UPI00081FF460|nr:response regulator transcription factor [Vogesella sp. LIG4]SCK14093.1 DNA-binding response regulator, NarL/FixJ family, contains REC and HTH domains [Vogesella sp. LIG4]
MDIMLISSSHSLQAHLQVAFGECTQHPSLWDLAASLRLPDGRVVWVDVDNQDEDLVQRLCRGDFGKARVVVMSSVPSDEAAVRWLGVGASGYVHAFAIAETLRQVAGAVSAGGVWIGVHLMQQLCARFGQVAKSDSPLLQQLTEREREVVDHLRNGKSNKQIARDMDISERTVKAHLTAIFGKFGVPDRVQLLLKLAV